jgi:hypothetical protein
MIDAAARVLPDPTAEPTIPVKRGGAILGIGLRNAYDAIERGEIPSIRVGRRIVIPTRKFLEKFGLLEPAGSVADAA